MADAVLQYSPWRPGPPPPRTNSRRGQADNHANAATEMLLLASCKKFHLSPCTGNATGNHANHNHDHNHHVLLPALHGGLGLIRHWPTNKVVVASPLLVDTPRIGAYVGRRTLSPKHRWGIIAQPRPYSYCLDLCLVQLTMKPRPLGRSAMARGGLFPRPALLLGPTPA